MVARRPKQRALLPSSARNRSNGKATANDGSIFILNTGVEHTLGILAKTAVVFQRIQCKSFAVRRRGFRRSREYMRGGRSIHTISGNWQARDNEPSALDRFHEDRAHIDGS